MDDRGVRPPVFCLHFFKLVATAREAGALQMAHEARKNSTSPTILRLAREIVIAQRKEIIELRKMLQSKGINKPTYYKFDNLFSL
jgi:hypothetical protein